MTTGNDIKYFQDNKEVIWPSAELGKLHTVIITGEIKIDAQGSFLLWQVISVYHKPSLLSTGKYWEKCRQLCRNYNKFLYQIPSFWKNVTAGCCVMTVWDIRIERRIGSEKGHLREQETKFSNILSWTASQGSAPWKKQAWFVRRLDALLTFLL